MNNKVFYNKECNSATNNQHDQNDENEQNDGDSSGDNLHQ